jgi:hypothetical protein
MDNTNEVLGTAGFPNLYVNHVAVSMSGVDVRIFLSEVSPREVQIQAQDALKPAEPLVTPRVCLVVAPEFAKTILDSLSRLIPEYESRFGPLRPTPQPQMPQADG